VTVGFLCIFLLPSGGIGLLSLGLPALTPLAVTGLAVGLLTLFIPGTRAGKGEGDDYRRIFEDGPLPAIVFDPGTLAIRAVNDAAVARYGFSRRDFTRLKMMQLGPVEDWQKLAGNPEPGNGAVTTKHRRKDGAWIDVQAVVRDTTLAGSPAKIMVVHDFTSRIPVDLELREKEETIRALLNARTDSALLLDLEGKILAANDTAAGRIGIPADRLRGRQVSECFEPQVAESRKQKLEEAVRTGLPVRFEDERGGYIFDNNMVPVVGASGTADRVAVFASDVTERRRAEEALKASETKYRSLVTVMKEGLMAVDPHDVITFVNPKVCEMLGYTPEEIIGREVATFLADRESQKLLEEKTQLRSLGVSDTYELALRTKSGRTLYVLVSGTPVLDETGKLVGSLGVLTDISERKRTEERIQAALTEKTVLLKEIHHRVKNNLQVISSLLNLQSSHITDDRIRQLFTESQNRIRSMALVHEKLYQSRDLSRIDCGEYLKSLAANLFRSYGGDARGIALRVEVNGTFLGIDAAIPCGLIVNELVTNSLKYAFPGADGADPAKPREVFVRLHTAPDESVRLCVGDNGVGFPGNLDFRSTTSLGLQLVSVLTDQLGGTIELNRGEGTHFTIGFPS
jgi:PAS domain S-box-containing protein